MADGHVAAQCWYYLDHASDAHQGPVHAAALTGARLVWREGMGAWLPPADVPEVAEALARAAHAAHAPPVRPRSQWYHQRADGSPEGPLGVGDLQAAMLSGQLDGMTRVWTEGMPAWLELREVPSLRALFHAAQETLRVAEAEPDAPDAGAGAEQIAEGQAAPLGADGAEAAGARAAEQPAAGAPAAAGGAEGGRKRKRPAKRFKANNPCSIYVSGLPPDLASEEALAELFAPCGLLKIDGATGAKKAKLYRDETGAPKGDGVLTFARPESVSLALSLRDGYCPPGHERPLRVQPARFEAKGAFAPTPKSKEELEGAKRARLQALKALSEWGDGAGLGSRGVRVVILKHLWAPEEASAAGPDERPAFYANLRADVLAECAKCGEVEKVTLFEGHPHGAAAVKFRGAPAAEACQVLMHGRRFGGRELCAEFFDGSTNYKQEATEAGGRPAGSAAPKGCGVARGAAREAGSGEDDEGEEQEGEGEDALDSHAEQQRRLDAMAAQLDAQSSSDDEPG